VENGFPASQIREELGRALASRHFSEAPNLSAFLKYIVEKALAGESDRVKEYAIATEVFGRPVTFDPRLDTIVRVQATKVRILRKTITDLKRNRSAFSASAITVGAKRRWLV